MKDIDIFEHNVEKTDDGIKVSYYMKKEKYIKLLEDSGYDRSEAITWRIQNHLIDVLSSKIQGEIYEEVMSKISIDSIAKATSVRMIQNMAK